MKTDENPESSALVECQGCNKYVLPKKSCPTCKELGIRDCYFCSQDCFKENWSEHKGLHKAVKSMIEKFEQREIPATLTSGHESMATFDVNDQTTWRTDKELRRFLGYNFAGPLHPWPMTPQVVVPHGIPTPDYAVDGRPAGEEDARLGHVIVEHNEDQIERIRRVCRLAREALDVASRMIKPGVTTDEIDEAVHAFAIENHAYPSPLNYWEFPKSCCTSVNEIVCHGIPDLRPLEEGDIVNVDVTLYLDGYHGDLNETFAVGEIDDKSKRLILGAYECLTKAIEQCRVGVMYRDLGHTIHKIADQRSLSVVRTYQGHGIGELFHTRPSVPHYRKNKAKGVMRKGHVFTIEPMINLGGYADKLWPDGWSSSTSDGSRSAQFEHTLLVTGQGVEILTARLPTSPPIGGGIELPEVGLTNKKVEGI